MTIHPNTLTNSFRMRLASNFFQIFFYFFFLIFCGIKISNQLYSRIKHSNRFKENKFYIFILLVLALIALSITWFYVSLVQKIFRILIF